LILDGTPNGGAKSILERGRNLVFPGGMAAVATSFLCSTAILASSAGRIANNLISQVGRYMHKDVIHLNYNCFTGLFIHINNTLYWFINISGSIIHFNRIAIRDVIHSLRILWRIWIKVAIPHNINRFFSNRIYCDFFTFLK